MGHEQILSDIVAALKGELGKDYGKIHGFVESQGRLLAKQAAGIATSRGAGSLADDDELYHFFLRNLKTNTENMAKSIVMMSILTIEKAWNAVAGVLWGAIRSILGAAGVADDRMPTTPPFSL